jgi:hypothetical protein
MVITPVLAFAGQNFLRHLAFIFKSCYLFIPQFPTEPQEFCAKPRLGITVLEHGKGPTIVIFLL